VSVAGAGGVSVIKAGGGAVSEATGVSVVKAGGGAVARTVGGSAPVALGATGAPVSATGDATGVVSGCN